MYLFSELGSIFIGHKPTIFTVCDDLSLSWYGAHVILRTHACGALIFSIWLTIDL